MYKQFLASEGKSWLRDPMMTFMLVYPLLLGLVGRYLLPLLAEESGFVLALYADAFLAGLTLFIPHIYGALLAFSILDDRDDNILLSIQATPLSLVQYLSFKVLAVLSLAFLSAAFVLWFADIFPLTGSQIIALAALASLGAPAAGFLINSFAKNKIEGFAVMKGIGATIVFPLIAVFLLDAKEFFFAFVPGFWPAKAISVLVRGEETLLLSFRQYYVIGLIYVLSLNAVVYRMFMKRLRH